MPYKIAVDGGGIVVAVGNDDGGAASEYKGAGVLLDAPFQELPPIDATTQEYLSYQQHPPSALRLEGSSLVVRTVDEMEANG